jgi:dihydroorotate dehydrogenase subfamily 1
MSPIGDGEPTIMNFAGLEFKNPFVVASSPLTAKVELLEKAEQFGAAAASTKLTFTKQLFPGKLRMYSAPRLGSIVCHDRRFDADDGVALVREAKKATSLILFANITHEGEDIEGWGRLARRFEEAGADIIEANLVCPNVSVTAKRLGREVASIGASVGQVPELCKQVIRVLKDAVDIPVVAKLTPNITDITAAARAVEEGGADGIVLAGAQLSLPAVDIHDHGRPCYPNLIGASMGSLGGPASRLLSYAAIAQIARSVRIPVVGGGGLQNWQHAVEFMMWGSTLVTACTQLMWYGFEVIPKILQGMERFVAEEAYSSYEELVGLSLRHLRAAQDLEVIQAVPVVNEERCDGCGICLLPGHCTAISMDESRRISIAAAACMGCAICTSVCPRGALSMQAV